MTTGNKILSDLDYKFLEKFDQEDVFTPCGKKAPYKGCKNIDFKADYIFVQNPYNHFKGSMLDPYYTLEGLKERTKKMAYVVYGPHIFHQDCCNDTKLKEQIDVVFVDSQSTKKLYVEKLQFDDKNIQVSGYESYKAVRDGNKLIRKQTKKTILWLPRWTVHFRERDRHEGGSTFFSYYRFFLNFARQNPDTNLIVRPHAFLFQQAIDSKFLTKDEMLGIKSEFTHLQNVTWSEHATLPLHIDILNSDMVISDGSSALAEVVVAKKPIIYLSNGINQEFESNELGKQLKEFIYLSHDPCELLQHLESIKKNGYAPVAKSLEKKYEEFRKKVDPVDNPAKFIVDYVENS